MQINTLLRCSVLAFAATLSACASAPAESPAPAPVAAAKPVAAAQPVAAVQPAASPEATSETEAATALEKKFQDAARSYKQVQKDGKTMYCKKEKPINSTIPRMQCITESQLRLEVEQMDDLRQRMRNQGRCTTGAGCGAGG